MQVSLIALVAATFSLGGTVRSSDPHVLERHLDHAANTALYPRQTEPGEVYPETTVAESPADGRDSTSHRGSFSVTFDGTVLHFKVSFPIAYEVKQGRDDPEGLNFRITRDGDATAPLTVGWRIEAAGANPVSAADFAAPVLPRGAITLEEGETTAKLLIQAFDDELVEPVETFRVVFFDPATGLTLQTSDSGTAIVDAEIPLPVPGLGTDAADLLIGRPGVDNLAGFAGNDILIGGSDGNYLHGGDGDDKLYGGGGSDVLAGEAGSDVYDITVGAAGRDQIWDFGSSTEIDTLVLSGAVTADLRFRAYGSDLVVTNVVTLEEVRVLNQFSAGGLESIAYTLRGSVVGLSRSQIAERAGQFAYNLGDGQQTFEVNPNTDNSMVRFGPGITSDTIGLSHAGRCDLEITVQDGAVLLVKNAFVNARSDEGFSGILFNNGGFISRPDLRSKMTPVELEVPTC